MYTQGCSRCWLLSSSALQLLLFVCTMSDHGLVRGAAPCTVCRDGVSTVNWPDKQLVLPPSVTALVPIPLDTCGTLDIITTGLVQEGTELCDAARLYGPVCGCPIPADACRLCPPTLAVEPSTDQLQSLPNPGLSLGQNMTAMVNADLQLALPADLDMTCELYDAVLTNYTRNDSFCVSSESAQERCGCGAEPPLDGGDNTEQNEQEEQVPDNNDSGPPDNQCTLCPYGEPVAFPDRDIDVKGLPLPKCGAFDLLIRTTVESNSTDECDYYRNLSKYCGCQMRPNACSMCRDKPLIETGTSYQWTEGGLVQANKVSTTSEVFEGEVLQITCTVLDSAMANLYDDGQEVCEQFQLRGETCGCEDLTFTTIKWSARASAFFSFVVSSEVPVREEAFVLSV